MQYDSAMRGYNSARPSGNNPQIMQEAMNASAIEIGGEDDPLTAEELMQLEQMGAIFPGGVRISEQD